MTKAQQQAYFYQKMSEFGFTLDEANSLRRIELTLHRWSEAECNGEIQREGDNGDGKPRRYYGQYMDHSYPTADREAGALKRLSKIMEAHPEWLSYHQTDPRGCALYIIRKDKLGEHPIDGYYSQGFGVCF